MKCETVLTKDYSNMVKGMAVLMMIMHHIWGFPEKIPALPLSNFEVQRVPQAKFAYLSSCLSVVMACIILLRRRTPLGFGIGFGKYISAFGRCS